jgi:hypothetical protein
MERQEAGKDLLVSSFAVFTKYQRSNQGGGDGWKMKGHVKM